MAAYGLAGLEEDGTLLLAEPEDFILTVVKPYGSYNEGGFLSVEYMGKQPTLRLFPFGRTNAFAVTLDGVYREPQWNERLDSPQPARTDAYGRTVDFIISPESLRAGRTFSDWRSKAEAQVVLTSRGLEQVAIYEDMMREGTR